jgi:hypothetical protein
MKNKLKNKDLGAFYNALDSDGMAYYSLTLFHKDVPVLSTCNNEEWLDLYSQKFNLANNPPVQKYIISSKLNFIMWEFFEIDDSSRNFINLRNQVVGVKNNVTILNRNKNTTKCLTFGTSKNSDHLVEFIKTGSFAKYL